MKNFKRSVMLIMVAVICLCSIVPVNASGYSQKTKEKVVSDTITFAKLMMTTRQDGEKYDLVMKEIVTDNKDLNDGYRKLFIAVINDAYYNYEIVNDDMGKKKIINQFTMKWYYKMCGLVGMNPE